MLALFLPLEGDSSWNTSVLGLPPRMQTKPHYNSYSFDIISKTIDLLKLPLDVGIFLQYLVPSRVLLLIAGTQSAK